jgi:hypothetical protein
VLARFTLLAASCERGRTELAGLSSSSTQVTGKAITQASGVRQSRFRTMGRLNLISGLPVIQTVRAFAIARFRQTGSEDLMAFK